MPAPLLGPTKTPGKRPSGRSPSPSPSRSSGGGLGFGNVPKPVLIGGVVIAVAIGLYLRYRSSSSTSAGTTTAAPALADTGTTGGASSGSAAGPDNTGFQSLADSINGLTGILGGGGTFQIQNGGTPGAGAPFALSGGAPTQPAGTVIDPVTGTTTNQAGFPTDTSYADLGITPTGTISAGSSLTYSGGRPVSQPVAPPVLPAVPHSTATLVHPAKPVAKPTSKPVSGYAQTSKSNLH